MSSPAWLDHGLENCCQYCVMDCFMNWGGLFLFRSNLCSQYSLCKTSFSNIVTGVWQYIHSPCKMEMKTQMIYSNEFPSNKIVRKIEWGYIHWIKKVSQISEWGESSNQVNKGKTVLRISAQLVSGLLWQPPEENVNFCYTVLPVKCVLW